MGTDGAAVLPGAEPFAAPGGSVGVLLVHGFTGSPQSMRPWAEHLNAAGFAVSLPLLPGHGTRWQDMNRTGWQDWYGAVDSAFVDLRQQCDTVAVCGLSMGGTLALRLAETHPQHVSAVCTVNASLGTQDRRAVLLPLLSRVLPSFPPVGNDIAKPGVTELAYDRLPLRAAASLQQLWTRTRADLGAITAPVLAFRSRTDHVVEAMSGALLRSGATQTSVREVILERSYHVATLDYDAELIFDTSTTFLREHAGAPA